MSFQVQGIWLSRNAPTMPNTGPPPVFAWQPLTSGGVAAFARASWGRLLVTELVVATAVTVSLVWFVAQAWLPVIATAIEQLPDQGSIRQGRLDWRRASPVSLAVNPFLSIVVDVGEGGALGQTADLQWAFGGTRLTCCSLFGCLAVRYPAGWSLPFDRTELEPWWGAWHPAILAALGVLAPLGLLLTWSVLALIYATAVRALAFFLDRDVSRAGCWRVAAAAQLPGALLLAVAITLYGLQRLNAAGLIVFFALHVGMGWVYLLLAAARLPRSSEVSPGPRNPFASPAGGSEGEGPPGGET